MPSLFRRLVLGGLLIAAGWWLADSARFALGSGWNSDVFREWVVSQYLIQGIDPWRISHETLQLNYGPPEEFRKRNQPIFEVHPTLPTGDIEGVLPQFGPPTSTYPPPGMVFFTLLLGAVPWHALLPFWLLVNGAVLAGLAALLRDWLEEQEPGRQTVWGQPIYLLCLCATLWWPPVQEVIRTSQFGLVIVLALVLGLRWMRRREWLAGLCFSLALFKPHISLPFLLLPLYEGRWRTLLMVAVTQLGALALVAWWLATPALDLVGHWLAISPYMLQGAYTLQEFFNQLHLDNRLGTLLTLAFAGGCAAWAWVYRRAGFHALTGFLALASVFWMYHERYDYTVLLLPILFVLAGSDRRRRGPAAWAVFGFLLLALALSDYAYFATDLPGRAVRWAGRVGLYGLLIGFAWMVRCAAQTARPDCASPSMHDPPSGP